MDAAIQQAYARAHIGTRECFAIELHHSEFPGSPGGLYYLNHDVDILISGNLYIAIPSQIAKPDTSGDGSQNYQIVLDNISGYLAPYLSNANQGLERIEATLHECAINTTNDTLIGIINSTEFSYKGDVVEIDKITIDLGSKNPGNVSFPSITYTPETHPALYR